MKNCHQPVTFLNSQHIRDSMVNNSRIATHLIALQGDNVVARYAKFELGNGLAACQNCSDDTIAATLAIEGPRQQPTCHRYFKENACQGIPTAYVNGCSYNHNGIIKAGVGVLCLND